MSFLRFAVSNIAELIFAFILRKMRFKVRVNGGDIHFRIDAVVYCDSVEAVERLRRFARRNKFQIRVELIEDE